MIETPKSAELLDMPGEVETVTVCGTEFELHEFTMPLRTLWKEHADEHKYFDVVRRFIELQAAVSELFSVPATVELQRSLVEELESRLTKALGKMKAFTPKVREELNAMAEQLDQERTRLREMQTPRTMEALEKSRGLDDELEEVRAKKRDVQLSFVYKLAATFTEDTALPSFEAWSADATGTDYQNAEEVVTVGNASWGVHTPRNRKERRAAAKK